MLFQPVPTKAATGINQQVNYQARLLNAQGAVVPDGTYNVQFKIYRDGDGTQAGDVGGSGGTLLWTESWQNSNSQGVTVKNGYFSVQLGAICALSGGSCQGNTNTGVDFNQSVLWLSVNIGGTTTGASPTYDGEMLPMRQLAAAPYALNSNELGGLTAAQFLQLAPNTVQTDSSTNSSIFVNKTGASGLLLELQSGGTDQATISQTGVITLSGTTGGLTIGATSVCNSTGSTGCVAKSGSGYYIHNNQGTQVLQNADFDVQGYSGIPTAIVEANGADSLDLQDSSGVNVATFGSTGSVLLKATTAATNAFQIQDTSGTSVFTTDTTNDRVGIGTNVPLNTLGVSPVQYNTGTASQSGTTITGSGTTWTSAMVGDQMVFANGVSETITAFGSTTSLTASVSQTVSGQAYRLLYPGLQVSNSGNVGIGQLAPSRLLDVAQNSTQTTAPMTLLEQNGTGDATLQFSNATNSNSFYVGQDASNGGSFRINSSVSSVTPTSPTAPALVQAANNGATGGLTTIAKAFTSTVTTGNAILVTFGWDPTVSNFTVSGCSDALNNHYTIAPVTINDPSATQSIGMCYATNVTGGTTDQVTITYSGAATFRTIIIQEYSGLAATTPVDVVASQDVATGTTTTDGVTSGPLVTTQNGDLIYGAVEDMNSTPNATISAGTGFSSTANQANATSNVLDENKVVTTAGSGPATFTFSLAHRYAALAVAFRPAYTSLTDTYNNSLFTLTQGGSATFQTTQNSTTAFQLQNNSGAAVLTADTVNGAFTIKSTGNSTTALQVLNASSVAVLTVDASGQNVSIGSSANLVINNTSPTSIVGPAWSSYTVTWTSSGTAPALGNGVMAGRYYKIGRVVEFNISFTSGTTTTYGSTNAWSFGLPVTSTSSAVPVSIRVFNNTGSAFWLCSGLINGSATSVTQIFCNDSTTGTASTNFMSSTHPFTWSGSLNTIDIEGTYESSS